MKFLLAILLIFSIHSSFASDNLIYVNEAPLGRGEYFATTDFSLRDTNIFEAKIRFTMEEQFPVDPICWEVNGEQYCEIASGRVVTEIANEAITIPGISINGEEIIYSDATHETICGKRLRDYSITLTGSCSLHSQIDTNQNGVQLKVYFRTNKKAVQQ